MTGRAAEGIDKGRGLGGPGGLLEKCRSFTESRGWRGSHGDEAVGQFAISTWLSCWFIPLVYILNLIFIGSLVLLEEFLKHHPVAKVTVDPNYNQVEEGVPLHICLSQFSKWIQKIQKEKSIIFASGHSCCATSEGKLCAFVTWSDWDLGVCLQYECKRKQLQKPDILNSWIDLRATYKDTNIYNSKRLHFPGLDDSRNTARLAWRMIRDGCVLKITKTLDKVPPTKNSIARFLSEKPSADIPLTSSDGAQASCLDKSRNGEFASEIKNNKENQQQEFSPVCLHGNISVQSSNRKKTNECNRIQSCLTPCTGRLNSSLDCFQASCCNPLGIQNGLNNGHLISNFSANNPGLVLVPTTLSTVNISDTDISTTPDCLSMLADWEDVALIPEWQDDHCSESLQSTDEPNHKNLFVAGKKMDMNESDVMSVVSENVGEDALNIVPSGSVAYKSPGTIIYNTRTDPNKFVNTSVFKLPTSKVNTAYTDVSNGKKQFTHPPNAPKRKPSSPKSLPPAKKPPFTVHEDKGTSPSNSLPFRSGLCSIPSGILKSSVNLNQSFRPTETGRVTPPVCKCGRRARRLNVSNGGPNHGRAFYSCPVGKKEGNRKSCGYFKWEDTLLKEKLTPLPSTSKAVGLLSTGASFSASENSQRKSLGLRPSMRT
ncbi:hypothetical protein JD844_019817 [Phrynosoma platyrhinos]|uniref:GRF-type domain-containing protein n=1 Tax=Phrynosoma platyrhinos TaxID=52577 RepID=A0ABQ7TR74_PHRPL|nr:hypothetical protein JD844_019817 [Phrynosoma platyrhinos]